MTWYERNRERVKAKNRARYHANKERISAERKARYALVREANVARKRKWYAENREKALKAMDEYRLLDLYGITPEDYERMLIEQGGGCAICGTERPGGRSKRLHVDHDHLSGRVRGLLCFRCNTNLAWVEKHKDKALGYLAKGMA